jgi:uncharacterized protein (DUF2141 family)
LAASACAGEPSDTKLTVHVSGLRSAKGEVAVTLYPDESRRFLAPKGKLARLRPVTKTPVTTVCFYLPKPGFYALAVYHDENADHDFNRTIIGMPAEGFGFSNNPSTKMGLPSYKSVRFEAGPGETQTDITLRYLR